MLEQLEDRLAPAVNNWVGAVSGNWTDATKWSDGVPTADDDVIIDRVGAAYTVTVNTNPTVNSLTLNSPDATLSASSRDITVAGATNFDAGTVTIAGTDFLGGGSLTNKATFNVLPATSTISGPFVQQGTLNVTNTLAIAMLNVGANFINEGTIFLNCPSTVLNATAGVTVTSGTLTNAANGVINSVGPNLSGITADLVNNGAININNTITFSKTNGAFTNNNLFSVAAPNGQVLFGTNGVFNQAAGVLDNQDAFRMNTDTFNFVGGIVTGNAPELTSSALNIGPGSTGAAGFRMLGTPTSPSTLSGDIAPAQTIRSSLATGAAVATLTAANSFTNSGTIILENPAIVFNATVGLAVTNGTLTNSASGVITTTGTNLTQINADVVNNGKVVTNQIMTLSKSNGVFTNNNIVTIAAPNGQLLFGANGVFTQAAGTLDNQGAIRMTADIFNFDGGIVTGNALELTSSALNIGPGSTGAASFRMLGTPTSPSTLSGDIAPAQTIRVSLATGSTSGFLTAASSYTNSGTIILENPAINFNVTVGLAVTNGTLTNSASGIITTTGTNLTQINADVDNYGSVTTNQTMTLAKTNGVFKNYNQFNVAAANGQLILATGGVFTQAAGTLDNQRVFRSTGGTFNFDGGTVIGNAPELTNSALNIGPSSTGAGTIRMLGSNLTAPLTLSGDIAPAQTVRVGLAVGGTGATLTAATSFTNAGTIILDRGGVAVTSGVLTNAATGLITTTGDANISADVLNQGTVAINNFVTLTKTGGVFTNQGQVTISQPSGLLQFGTNGIFTQAAGTFDNQRIFRMNADTFNFDGGTVIGNAPELTNSALNIGSGSTGAGTFSMLGSNSAAPLSLSGDIAPAQTVRIGLALLGTGATLTAATGFTNAGTIILDAGNLTLASGTLTNAATGKIIVTNIATVVANIDNDGAVDVANILFLTKTNGVFTNRGVINIGSELNDRVSIDNGAFINQTTGTIAGGRLIITNDASFSGVGTISTKVENSGTLNPGSSPGVLNIVGTYTQSFSGKLNIELAGDDPGTGYDQLNITGAASLAGTLNVMPVFPYCPEGTYTILTYGSRTGDFATKNGLNLGAGRVITASPLASLYDLNVNVEFADIAGAPASSPEGTAINLAPPWTNSALTYEWSVTKDGMPYASQTGATPTFSFTPDDNAIYEVHLLAYSAGPIAHANDTKMITVTNVDPTAVITGAPASSPEGTTITLGFGLTDPGSADTHTQAWTVTKNGNAYASGTGPDFSFTPDDDGSYVVTLTVTDDDGGAASDSKAVLATNVDPSDVALNMRPATIDENGVVTLSGSFTDPGTADLHTVVINWGDGSPDTTLVLPAGVTTFSVPHQYLNNQPGDAPYAIGVGVTDDGNAGLMVETGVTVLNVAPTVNAGPDAAIDAGALFGSSGSFADPGADTWTATVDYGDGSGQQVLSLNLDKTFALNHIYAVAGNYTVTTTVSDDDGGTSTDTVAITVTAVSGNNAPAITHLSNSSPECGGAAEGEPVTIFGRFVDADRFDSHTALINWGDGSTSMGGVSEMSGTVTGSHVYANGGFYTITVTLSDNHSLSDSKCTTAVVTGAGVVNGTLFIIGTDRNDHVTVNQQGNGILKVHADFFANANFKTFSIANITRIIAHLCDGDDEVTIAGNITLPALLDAGDGADHLNSGGGPSVLIGGDGDDMLIGGKGRNVLIGGSGADRLVGNNGDDLLVGGLTAFDANYDALFAILGEWTSGRDYAMRITNLTGAGSGTAFDHRLNGNFFLKSQGPDKTVFEDGAQDKLTGSAGRDWFFANVDAGIIDILTDLHGSERLEKMR